jgi:hypothetical protein
MAVEQATKQAAIGTETAPTRRVIVTSISKNYGEPGFPQSGSVFMEIKQGSEVVGTKHIKTLKFPK